MPLCRHNASSLKNTQLWKDQLMLNPIDPLNSLNTDQLDLDTDRQDMVPMEMQTEKCITLGNELLKLNLIAMVDTLEVKVDMAMEVLDMEALDMDLEVTEVDTILERDLLKLNPIVTEDTLEVKVDMGVLDLAMEALDMDLEVTEVDSILENVQLMKT